MKGQMPLCGDCATWEGIVQSTLKQFGREDRADRMPTCRALFGPTPKRKRRCAILRCDLHARYKGAA